MDRTLDITAQLEGIQSELFLIRLHFEEDGYAVSGNIAPGMISSAIYAIEQHLGHVIHQIDALETSEGSYGVEPTDVH